MLLLALITAELLLLSTFELLGLEFELEGKEDKATVATLAKESKGEVLVLCLLGELGESVESEEVEVRGLRISGTEIILKS